MERTWRLVSQVFFAVLFFALVTAGKVQLWMGIFLLGIIMTFLFGRVYCGWICPINTLMNLITAVKRKLRIKSLAVPGFIKKPAFRYAMLAAFVLTFVFVMSSGKKLPVLPGLLALGVFLTFFFTENLWHRYLCPYGTILGAAGRLARRSYQIDDYLCISCSACKRVCPADAVEVNDYVQLTESLSGDTITGTSAPGATEFPKDAIGTGKKKRYTINKSECLVCGACVLSCSKNAIVYK
ncbi:MAG: 4Fe-4S binding protein [Clostridiales bacterium]|jgi:ferredoxin-type protein NapH|nr:4Fe-4S binding protein [Clostridiales bacterium]